MNECHAWQQNVAAFMAMHTFMCVYLVMNQDADNIKMSKY